MTAEVILEVTALACEREQRQLFSSLSFSVKAGSLIHIKGANGAGKTTLLRILCGLFAEYEGSVDWKLEKHPLFLGHKPGVKDLMTVEENLRWLCELHDTQVQASDIHKALSETGLRSYREVAANNLSEGQRKRISLARLYLIDSPVWILDEPFSAIDVEGVKKLESHMADYIGRGGCIILTSHQALEFGAAVEILNLDTLDKDRAA